MSDGPQTMSEFPSSSDYPIVEVKPESEELPVLGLDERTEDASSAADLFGHLRLPVPRDDVPSARIDPLEDEIERRIFPLRRAFNTIPVVFHWASFSKPTLATRIKPPKNIAAAELITAAKKATGSMLLIGPSGSGKTSLAAACMLQLLKDAKRIIRDTVQLAFSMPRPVLDEATRRAHHEVIRMARGARFVTAFDLAKAGVQSPLGAVPELVEQALSAELLVLDDLGMDAESFRQSAIAVREVLHTRHAQGRRTIVTTYLQRQALSNHYGQGIARRLEEGLVLRFG